MDAITRICLKVVQKYLPGAFLLAIFLTFVTFLSGIFVTGKSVADMINYWGKGYSSLFTFGMQMVLVLLTGYVLALTTVAKNILDKVTDIPKTPKQALGLTALVSLISCYLNWALVLLSVLFLPKKWVKKLKVCTSRCLLLQLMAVKLCAVRLPRFHLLPLHRATSWLNLVCR